MIFIKEKENIFRYHNKYMYKKKIKKQKKTAENLSN